MSDTFFRLIRLLQLVPRAPKFIDTAHIEDVLTSEGIVTTRRSIQRDLIKLESMGFGLECLETSKPYRWRFLETADAMLMPGLDPQAALALRLVELHIERMLPRATLRALQPHLQAAKKALDGKTVAKWLDKVRLIPRSQPLLPPKLDGAIVGVVHEALLEGRQIQARYHSRANDKVKDLSLHPLGLVHRDSVPYLVATAHAYEDVRLYPLQRFTEATMLEARAKTPKGFDLDAYISQGELSYRHGDKDVDVSLVFQQGVGHMLEETALAHDQTVTRRENGELLVEACVPDTQVLRAWLIGFGDKVEVKKPAALRKFVAAAHTSAAARYSE
ncbi:MAG: WYL domain-containing protein [Deltaproteobacteria bacterium]|nr:WYL domain-containing protein [Deltaproteobacteria bacterium]